MRSPHPPYGHLLPGREKGTVGVAAEPAGRRGTVMSRGERVGGERGVEQERLGLVDAQAPDGHQRLDGHIVGRLVGQVAPQPLEGAIAIAPGLVDPAQVMAGQGQQEAVEGRGVGPRRGPGQDGGGRRPVAEEDVGRPEPRQAIPLRVGLDRSVKLGSNERERPVRDRQAEPAQGAVR